MENKTKIYIGVGAAALVAFLLFRNKAAAQKPVVPPMPDIIPQFPVKDSVNQNYDEDSYGGYAGYGCPEGTKPCQNNPNKCVSTNPDIRYIKDPCS